MKKLLISLLIGTMVLGVSCGKEETKSSNNVETKHESVEDTKDKTQRFLKLKRRKL